MVDAVVGHGLVQADEMADDGDLGIAFARAVQRKLPTEMFGFLFLDGDRRVGATQAPALVLGFEGNPIPFAETTRHERAMPVGKGVVGIQQFARRGRECVKRAGVEGVFDDDGIEPAIQGLQLMGPCVAPVLVEPGVVAMVVPESPQDLPPATPQLAPQPEGDTRLPRAIVQMQVMPFSEEGDV